MSDHNGRPVDYEPAEYEMALAQAEQDAARAEARTQAAMDALDAIRTAESPRPPTDPGIARRPRMRSRT